MTASQTWLQRSFANRWARRSQQLPYTPRCGLAAQCLSGPYIESASCSDPAAQLGLGNIGVAMPGGYFGEGAPGQPLWLDEVTCLGSEVRLEECAHAGWGVSNW